MGVEGEQNIWCVREEGRGMGRLSKPIMKFTTLIQTTKPGQDECTMGTAAGKEATVSIATIILMS